MLRHDALLVRLLNGIRAVNLIPHKRLSFPIACHAIQVYQLGRRDLPAFIRCQTSRPPLLRQRRGPMNTTPNERCRWIARAGERRPGCHPKIGSMKLNTAQGGVAGALGRR
jgi:hypothetical protein